MEAPTICSHCGEYNSNCLAVCPSRFVDQPKTPEAHENQYLRDELTTLHQRAEAAERRVAELEGDARLGLRYTVGTEARTLFAMPDADAAKNFALELSSQLGQATWIRDHDAKAAIDAAGGQQ